MLKENDLLKMKEKIETAKQELSELQGKKKYLEQELLSVWGCKNVNAAIKKQQELTTEIQELEEKIESEIEELQNEYPI